MRRVANLDELFVEADAFLQTLEREMPWDRLDALFPGIESVVRDARRGGSPRARRVGRTAPFDPYAALGLCAGASRAEAAVAYRRLAKRWHPDLPTGDAGKMAAINAAYASICESQKHSP